MIVFHVFIMIIDLCDSPIPKASVDICEIDDTIEQQNTPYKSGLSSNVLKFIKSTSFSSSSSSTSIPSINSDPVNSISNNATITTIPKTKKPVKKQDTTASAITISDITNTANRPSSVATAKPKYNPYKKNKYYNKSTTNTTNTTTAIPSSQASSSSSSQSTNTTTAILTQDSQLTDLSINPSSTTTTNATTKMSKTKRTTPKHTSTTTTTTTNQPPTTTTTTTPKYPKNSNTYYSEVSITILPSLISSEHTLALLDKFAFDSTDLTLLTTPTTKGHNSDPKASNNSTSKLSKKTKEKNLNILLQHIDQNKLRSLTDKSLFTLYINSNNGTNSNNSIPGLCLWNHRKIELGGRCRIGSQNSDLFPFVVIDYCPQKFVDLVFNDLG